MEALKHELKLTNAAAHADISASSNVLARLQERQLLSDSHITKLEAMVRSLAAIEALQRHDCALACQNVGCACVEFVRSCGLRKLLLVLWCAA